MTTRETDQVPMRNLAEEDHAFADNQPIPTPRLGLEEEFEPTIERGRE